MGNHRNVKCWVINKYATALAKGLLLPSLMLGAGVTASAHDSGANASSGHEIRPLDAEGLDDEIVVSATSDGAVQQYRLSRAEIKKSKVLKAALLSGESILELGEVHAEAFKQMITFIKTNEIIFNNAQPTSELVYEQNRWDVEGLDERLQGYLVSAAYLDNASVEDLAAVLLVIAPFRSPEWITIKSSLMERLAFHQHEKTSSSKKITKLLSPNPTLAEEYKSLATNPSSAAVARMTMLHKQKLAAESSAWIEAWKAKEEERFQAELSKVEAEIRQAALKSLGSKWRGSYKKYYTYLKASKMKKALKEKFPQFEIKMHSAIKMFDLYSVVVTF